MGGSQGLRRVVDVPVMADAGDRERLTGRAGPEDVRLEGNEGRVELQDVHRIVAAEGGIIVRREGGMTTGRGDASERL